MKHYLTREQQILLVSSGVLVFGLYVAPSLSGLMRLVFKFLIGRLKRLKKSQQNYIQVGGLKINDDSRLRHTHILGSTGSGKSVLIEQLLFQDLERGQGAIIIDAKGDRAFYQRVKRFCTQLGRGSDLSLLSTSHIQESALWNPCRLGSPSELQSKFFGAARYEESFYAKAVESALIRAFQNISAKELNLLTLNDLVSELKTLTKDGRDENLKGVYFDFDNLSRSDWAPLFGLTKKSGIQKEVSFLDVVRKNEILFIDLPTEGQKVQSERVGRLLLQEILLLSGLRKRFPHLKSGRPFSVYIDEFDAFATPSFISFLNKGRSSEFMIHMAHQTLSDLKLVHPDFEGQLIGNTNCRFFFRVDLPDDAEKCALIIGTKKVTKTTSQIKDGASTGMGTIRETQEFIAHPDQIKNLKVGECVVSIKTQNLSQFIQIPFIENHSFGAYQQLVHREALTLKLSSIKSEPFSEFQIEEIN
ncbi:MAG: type IV secretion system DNA-binding domain-containing protein [Xanthomonadaceae bacterium]|nr:type IV secretion system DNA-binding domain-containing protein [Xanthomonadaceae bacterium]